MPVRTRRSWRGLAAAVTALTLAGATACGSSDEPAGEPTGEAGGSAAAAFPVSVTHKYGSTSVPKAPTKVVSVGLVEQDALLALGVVPVATTEWFGERPGAIWPWAQDELGGAPAPQVLSNVDGIQFEKIAALRPDLIVGLYSDLSEKDYQTLSKIAPTVAPPADVANFGISWQDLTRTVGKAVGKPAEADKLVKDNEARISKVREETPGIKGSTALFVTNYEGIFVYGPQDSRSRLLQDLGFTLPEGLAAVTGTEFGKNLSRERTDLLDVDALFWLVEDYAKAKPAIQNEPLYNALTVRKEGRDIFIEEGKEFAASLSMISVLSLPYMLDGLAPQIKQAIDGDPATAVTPVS